MLATSELSVPIFMLLCSVASINWGAHSVTSLVKGAKGPQDMGLLTGFGKATNKGWLYFVYALYIVIGVAGGIIGYHSIILIGDAMKINSVVDSEGKTRALAVGAELPRRLVVASKLSSASQHSVQARGKEILKDQAKAIYVALGDKNDFEGKVGPDAITAGTSL